MADALYNTEILRLAATIPHMRRLEAADGTSVRVSPICGSRITADVTLDAAGRVSAFGQEVRACALGQASAAILGTGVVGQTADALAAARDGLADYLAGRSDAPPADWPRLALFAPARAHKARHGSIMLAFQAAADAATAAGSNAEASGMTETATEDRG